VEKFIGRGADVNIMDNAGTSLLHVALHAKSTRVALTLIAEGAGINAVDKHGRTPLHSALHSGIKSSVLQALIDKGADVNQHDNGGQTPLTYALRRRRSKIILSLIENGAKVNTVDDSGSSPLHYAVKYNVRCDVCASLLRHGAFVNARDRDGNIALHIAFQNSYLETALLLILWGADVSLRNNRGLTALEEYNPPNYHQFELEEVRALARRGVQRGFLSSERLIFENDMINQMNIRDMFRSLAVWVRRGRFVLFLSSHKLLENSFQRTITKSLSHRQLERVLLNNQAISCSENKALVCFSIPLIYKLITMYL
jgi:ankyrin repeat protein